MSLKSIAVIGGGITGLAAAYYLKQQSPEHRVPLFEANTRLGGNIITEERDGFVIDGGPDSFLRTKPYAVNLCRELGLESKLVILGMLLSQKLSGRAGAQTLGQLSPQEIFQWLTRAEAAAPSPFYSLEGGMGGLIAALEKSLRPEDVHVGTRIKRLEQLPGQRWRLQVSDRAPCDVDAILLAAPARVAAKLLAQRELVEELSSIPYVSTATVFFALNQADVAHPLDGLGFIAPKGEAEILAGTWVSSKWEHRAPPGKALVRAFLGGSRGSVDLAKAADTELSAVAFSELERLMGSLGRPLFSRVFRYINANPQPIVGHAGRLSRIRAHVSGLGRLELAGAAYEGVGIPDCIRQAKTAAERLLQELC